jgi:hypothetical protein
MDGRYVVNGGMHVGGVISDVWIIGGVDDDGV